MKNIKVKNFGETEARIVLRTVYDYVENEYISYPVLKVVYGSKELTYSLLYGLWKKLVREFHKELNYLPKQVRNAILGMFASYLYNYYGKYAFI